MIRLMICDDHELVRLAMVRLLEADGRFTVVAQVGTGDQLLKMLVTQARDIDVLLLDLNIHATGQTSSMELIGKLRHTYANLPVLVVSGYDGANTVKAVMQAGASGFVTKNSAFEVLQQAIRYVHLGEHFLDPRVVHTMFLQDTAPLQPAWNGQLTSREREVLKRLCAGERVSHIANALGLSIKTVSTHKFRLMAKLHIDNMADLIKLCLQHELC